MCLPAGDREVTLFVRNVLKEGLELEDSLARDDGGDSNRLRAELEMTSRLIDLVLYLFHGLDSAEVDQLPASQELIRSVGVTSPIDGIVRRVEARPGQLVQATDHLVEVVDPAQVYLVGEVLESDTHLISHGMAITAASMATSR